MYRDISACFALSGPMGYWMRFILSIDRATPMSAVWGGNDVTLCWDTTPSSRLTSLRIWATRTKLKSQPWWAAGVYLLPWSGSVTRRRCFDSSNLSQNYLHILFKNVMTIGEVKLKSTERDWNASRVKRIICALIRVTEKN